MGTREITVNQYENGQFVRTVTQQEDYDDARQQVFTSYAAATQAVRDNTNVPLVLKAWIIALNRLLRQIIQDMQE